MHSFGTGIRSEGRFSVQHNLLAAQEKFLWYTDDTGSSTLHVSVIVMTKEEEIISEIIIVHQLRKDKPRHGNHNFPVLNVTHLASCTTHCTIFSISFPRVSNSPGIGTAISVPLCSPSFWLVSKIEQVSDCS